VSINSGTGLWCSGFESALHGCHQRAGIIMEGWSFTASCLALQGESGPAGVVCIVMDGLYIPTAPTGPYHLLWLAVAAQLFPAAVTNIQYDKCTRPTTNTEITHDRQGPALHLKGTEFLKWLTVEQL
jgi:hypothetical protein